MSPGHPRKIGFFTFFWGKGYGVAAVIRSQIEILSQEGYEIDVFALDVDPSFNVPGVRVFEVAGSLKGLRTFVMSGGYDCAIAHTQPFHRFVVDLPGGIGKIVYDHGEPPPEWFPEQRAVREALRTEKRELVCPKADLVVAISQFISDEIPWPDAKILYNGADHLFGKYPDSEASAAAGEQPVFLCVARFGPQERIYKGLDQLVRFAQDFGGRFKVVLAGKGSSEDRLAMEQQGLAVCLNPSDRELSDLYRSADAVISFSRWEGFNLPIIEGAFFGRPGYALDVGAHKEVTPFCFGSYEALRQHLQTATKDSLKREGRSMRIDADRFTWRRNVDGLVHLLEKKGCFEKKVPRPGGSVQQIAIRGYWWARAAARKWKRRLHRS
jgi:glycosyltransferase involved in cell wall biosynthesis